MSILSWPSEEAARSRIPPVAALCHATCSAHLVRTTTSAMTAAALERQSLYSPASEPSRQRAHSWVHTVGCANRTCTGGAHGHAAEVELASCSVG
eukprot:4302542-Prymnesium_polylepis.1